MRRLSLICFAAALTLGLGAGLRDGVDQWVDRTVLPPLDIATGAELRDQSGDLLRAYTVEDGRWRLAVDPDQVDPRFVQMLLMWEDQRFLSHPGVDLRATARAGWQALRQGRIVSGASTLTMQVARLLEDSGTGRLSGKLRQVRVALALERRLTKPQILALYLHLAPYGGNAEGLRAASLMWFGKDPRRLNPAEAALLVALPQGPEQRRPDRNPQAAQTARDRVLARAEAVGLITAEAAVTAQTVPVPTRRRPFPQRAPLLSDRLVADLGPGAIIPTTLDGAAQARVEDLATRVAARGRAEGLSLAILVVDHQSGAIRVAVGSGGYQAGKGDGFVDMTRAYRSPGSTLKPLIYGLAIDAGLAHPETLIDDVPRDFGGWRPQNFDRQFRGTVRVRDALQASLNLPVVSLLDALGPAPLMVAMARAGMAPRLPGGQAGLAVGLGGVGVRLEGVVGLYAALARGGEGVRVSALPGAAAPGRQILSPAAAWHVTDMLSGVTRPANAPRVPVAFKTGTSYGHRDAWAIGYDGRHVVGVWLGRPDGTPVPGAFGADRAAPLVFEVFGRLSRPITPLPPAPPGTLTVSNAELPIPLQRFEDRAGQAAALGPKIAFPPAGAVLEGGSDLLMARVAEGRAPFTWLLDGAPIAPPRRGRDVHMPAPQAGFATLSVIDATGRGDQVQIRIADQP